MTARESPWMIIHMIYSRRHAEMVLDLLNRNGFMVKVRPMGGADEEEDTYYEVLALSSEAREARGVLQEAGF